METWNLPKTVPVYAVRDNGTNIKAAIKKLVYQDIPCFAHTLQLAIGDAVDQSDGMKAMLIKCCQIVGHNHHSCRATEKLENKMWKLNGDNESRVLSLIQSCPICLNSDYFMVEKLLTSKESVCRVD